MELYLFTRSAFVARSCQFALKGKGPLHVMQEKCLPVILSLLPRIDVLLLDSAFFSGVEIDAILASARSLHGDSCTVCLLMDAGIVSGSAKSYGGRAVCLNILSLDGLQGILDGRMQGRGTRQPERLERIKRHADLPGLCGGTDPVSASKRESFLERVKTIARTRADLLLVGESGSGKSWLAEKIYVWSGRQGNFLGESLADIPPNLFESELFGTVSGAYTDAVNRMGLLEAAGDGTLFLDEIGELPLNLQSKLFSALDKRSFRRVGSLKEQSFTGRIIFATNMDLEQAVREKSFREELYNRISMVTIRVPPLRERPGDIPALASQFAGEAGKSLSSSALEKLSAYEYPGNIRELKHIVCRSCLLSQHNTLEAADISFSRSL